MLLKSTIKSPFCNMIVCIAALAGRDRVSAAPKDSCAQIKPGGEKDVHKDGWPGDVVARAQGNLRGSCRPDIQRKATKCSCDGILECVRGFDGGKNPEHVARCDVENIILYRGRSTAEISVALRILCWHWRLSRCCCLDSNSVVGPDSCTATHMRSRRERR